MTTMNTAAASLSDEQRTTIQHAADKLRTVSANFTGDKESRELCHKLEAILAPGPQTDAARCSCCGYLVTDSEHRGCLRAATPHADADFKNFHRLLCERFDYAHDERDWKRDQLSLIEHIASRAAIDAGGAKEAVRLTADDADMFWPELDGEQMYHSLDDAVTAVFDDCGADAGDTFTFTCAARLPKVTVRIIEVTENGFEWEEIDLAKEPK